MSKKQKIECLDIELDLEMEQSAAPDMSCLPTLHKSDIPKEKENITTKEDESAMSPLTKSTNPHPDPKRK